MHSFSTVALVLTLVTASASAQVTPYVDPAGTTYQAGMVTPETTRQIDEAVAEAMRASNSAMADSTAPEALEDILREMEAAIARGEEPEMPPELEAELEGAMTDLASGMAQMMGAMFGLSPEELEEIDRGVRAEASGARVRESGNTRLYKRRAAQTFPVVQNGYGVEGDGFPSRMTVSGTVVEAGSLRICRFDAPPVSRWLRIRLNDTSEEFPSEEIVVAVQCHEDRAGLLVGRDIRLDVWKTLANRPIRMVRDNAPQVGAPMYESYPGNIRFMR